MRQERTIQATIFEVFAQHEIGCELKAMSQWLDGQRQLTSLVAGDLLRQGVRETGRHGLPAVAPHLMVTDPPYGVNYDPAWRNQAGRSINGTTQRSAELIWPAQTIAARFGDWS